MNVAVVLLLVASVAVLGGSGKLPGPSGRDRQTDQQRLVDAVRQQNLSAVVRLLEGVKATDLYPALVVAARIGDVPMVRALLDRGADPNAGAGGPSETPLVAATLDGHFPVISLLLSRGADPNTRSGLYGYETPLLYAAGSCHVKALDELLAGKADPNVRFGLDEKGRFIQDRAQGPTPLMIAARGGHLTCMEILVEAGADPTLRDAAGLTAQDHLNRFLAREVPRINNLMRRR